MQTKVDSIAFFNGGATVRRSGIPDGEIVEIAGLPADVREDTLTVVATGGDVAHCKLTDEEKAGGEKSQALHAAWIAAQTAVEKNELAIEFYRQNLKVNGELQTLDDALGFFSERFDRLLTERSNLREAAERAKKAYEDCKDKSRTAVVRLSGKPAELTLTYVTHTAGWNAQRELYADGKSDVRCVLKAQVYNNGGEDYVNVPATFSARAADAFTVLPTFEPDYIGRTVPARVMARAAAPMLLSADTNAAAVEAETDIDVTYSLDRVTVLAGETAGFTLQTQSFATAYELIVPSYRVPKAFFAATVANPLDGGVVRVYYNGRSLGETCVPSDERPSFALGAADRIVVKKEQGKKFTSQNLIKGEKTEYRYTVTVRNDRSQAVDLHVVDRVPVSTDKSIVVDATQTSDAKYDAETGRLDWFLKLKAGAKIDLPVSYTVKNNN